MLVRVLIASLLITGCGFATETGSEPEPPTPGANDARAYQAFPEILELLAASYLPADESGLIGRNREWGELYSPRFQMGSGLALRVALVAERADAAARAFGAIEVAAETVRADGLVPSALPPSMDAELSPGNIASAAAFFLGDACLGLLALEAVDRPDAVVFGERRARVREKLVRASRWLRTQKPALMAVDRAAPNRLLFNARAFQACGALAIDGQWRSEAEADAGSFVAAALALQADDGHFIEGGGHDTSYQGVALSVGEEVLWAGYSDPQGRLRAALDSAAQWLLERVGPDGRIDSTGNARTCTGGEAWMGKPKRLSVSEVLTGLIYAGVRTGRDDVQEAARRIARWLRASPGTAPCFSRNP